MRGVRSQLVGTRNGPRTIENTIFSKCGAVLCLSRIRKAVAAHGQLLRGPKSMAKSDGTMTRFDEKWRYRDEK